MKTVWLICRNTDEAALVNWETVEKVVGVEAGYIAEVVRGDGAFENGRWKVRA